MRIILFLFIFFYSLTVFAQRTCGADHMHQHNMLANPEAKKLADEIESFTSQYIEQKKMMRTTGEESEIIIPVVFHVVYNTQNQNIPDSRLIEQIEVLNRDFNALNNDLVRVPGPFQSSIGRVNVRFVLANRDPKGRVTTGITRTKTTKTSAFTLDRDDVKSFSSGGMNSWDTKSYLNIWVCNLQTYLGYATFPYKAGTKEDGVVLNYRYVGVTGATRPFNLGRTATHEVGHYLNLLHIWGQEGNCTSDDGVSDTPSQYTYSAGVPVFPDINNSCSKTYPGTMFMNYMDYSYDTTLLMFSTQQALRMEAILNGVRSSLKNSKGYVSPIEFDLSTSGIQYPLNIVCDNVIEPALNVISMGNEKITSFDISMQIDDGEVITQTWTGELNLFDTEVVKFAPVELDNGEHRIYFTIHQPNGKDDNDLTNDTVSKMFTVGVSSISLPFTEDFESANIAENGFAIVNPDNALTWARSSYRASKNGYYSYFMNNRDYDPDLYGTLYGEMDDIVLPFLNFTDVDEIAMSFEVAAAQRTGITQTVNNWDSLQVIVSVDCGRTFDVVYNKYAGRLITVAGAQSNFFTPASSSQWRSDSVNLTQYAGMDNVLIAIRNISHFENNIYIDDLSVYRGKVVSVREHVSNRDVELYPNPGSGLVTIKINEPSVRLKQVSWMNILGQTILDEQMNTYSGVLQFNLSQQPKGVYIARLLFEDGSVTTKKFVLE